MSLDDRFTAIQAVPSELRLMLERQSSTSGGGDGGVQDRITRLESRMDKVSEKLGTVGECVATLTERVAHLPSKGFIVTALGTSVAILGGLTLIAQRIGLFG